jgi:hypothetical protein
LPAASHQPTTKKQQSEKPWFLIPTCKKYETQEAVNNQRPSIIKLNSAHTHRTLSTTQKAETGYK